MQDFYVKLSFRKNVEAHHRRNTIQKTRYSMLVNPGGSYYIIVVYNAIFELGNNSRSFLTG